jgi:hypothetical protein
MINVLPQGMRQPLSARSGVGRLAGRRRLPHVKGLTETAISQRLADILEEDFAPISFELLGLNTHAQLELL